MTDVQADQAGESKPVFPTTVPIPPAPERPQAYAVLIPFRTLLVVTAFGAFILLTVVAAPTLLSIMVAAVLALGLDPVVARLTARGWSRGVASLTTFAGLFVGVLLLILVTAGPLWEQIVAFVKELPAYWEELSSKPGFQDILDALGADHTVANALKELAAGLPDAASAVLGVVGGVASSVLLGVTLSFLALFLLMERPTITAWLFGFTPPEVEDRWSPVVENAIRTVSSSLIGNVAISFVAGTVTFIAASLLDMPFPIVLAVMTGLLDLIPQVGATVAAVILVAIALTVSTEAAVIMTIVQLVYQQLENYVIYPIVYRQAVELSGFTTIVAVLIAGAVLGVVGAILAVPLTAVIKVLLHEATRPRRERMEALRAARGDAPATEAAA